MSLGESLRKEYGELFTTCQVRDEKLTVVEGIIQKIEGNRNKYKSVGKKLGVPWYFIAIIHNMESSLNFKTHLHNGDSLSRRTRQIPKGRPKTGNPPFTWEESAEDALKIKKLHEWTDWSIEGMLYKLERYNGWGYRKYHPEVKSPYLWSYTNQYSKGKYTSDGTFSYTAVSKQVGAAAILRRMAEKGLLETSEKTVEIMEPTPKIVFSKSKSSPEAKKLQVFLNSFSGIFLKEDGVPGPKTSEAFEKLFGSYLDGDPRK